MTVLEYYMFTAGSFYISGGIVFDVELSKRILSGDVNREKPISIDEKDGALTFAN